MVVAGWARPDMLLRYTRARASSRAAEKARGLGWGSYDRPPTEDRPPVSTFAVSRVVLWVDYQWSSSAGRRGLAVRQLRDTSAFAGFVETRSHNLLRTAYLMVGDHQLAQDLLQEALIKTLIAWPRLRDPEKVDAYARRTVVTTAISWRRRRSFHEAPVEFPPEPIGPDQAEHFATHQVLIAHLRVLPPRQRAAIVLRYYEDLTLAQTAEVMGCTVGSVKSHVSIGLGKLRERMGSDFDLVPTGEREVTS